MLPSPRISRCFYAIALVAFGTQHFVLGDFVAGRAIAWPEGLPVRVVFAFASGAILVVAGVAIIVNWKARLAAFTVGVMVLLWAGLRNLFELILSPDYGTLLVNTNKSLTLGFGAFLVASTFSSDKNPLFNNSGVDKTVERLAPLSRYFTGFFLFASGIQHFLFVDFVKFLVPTWIPGSVFWTYFAAIALIAAGLGLMLGIKRELAATLAAWMIFIWFLILHIPRALGADGNANEWTAVFESLAVSGILFLEAAHNNRRQPEIYTRESSVPASEGK